jgi:hypothetical protein
MVAQILIVLAMVVALSGCATKTNVVSDVQSSDKTSVPTEAGKIGQMDLLIEPVNAAGIKETQKMREGNFSTRRIVFPEMLAAGELFPGRVSWYGWLVSKGKEFLVQLILEPGNNLRGQLMGVALIDGTEQEIAGGKMMGFSTRIKKLYSLKYTEDEFAVEKRETLLSDSKYRQEIVEKYGVEVDQLPRADEFLNEFVLWNRVEMKDGWMLTPLTQSQFDYVARINPVYSHSQKWVASTHGSISLSPYGTLANLFFEQIYATQVKPEGWDFDSVSSNAISAQRIKFILDRKQAVIDELNRQLKQQQKELAP